MKRKVRMSRIASDFDNKTYDFPQVEGVLRFCDKDLENASSDNITEKNEDGFIGLHLSDKLKRMLPGDFEVDGFEFVKTGYRYELRLRSKRPFDYDTYRHGIVFQRLCIHPKSGELIGDCVAQHAGIILAQGNYSFQEYVRLTYVDAREAVAPALREDRCVLLTRPYYRPSESSPTYNIREDARNTLKALALMTLNGLPDDTKIFPSADRNIFNDYVFD